MRMTTKMSDVTPQCIAESMAEEIKRVKELFKEFCDVGASKVDVSQIAALVKEVLKGAKAAPQTIKRLVGAAQEALPPIQRKDALAGWVFKRGGFKSKAYKKRFAVYEPRTSHSPSSCMRKPPSAVFIRSRNERSLARSRHAYARSVPSVARAHTAAYVGARCGACRRVPWDVSWCFRRSRAGQSAGDVRLRVHSSHSHLGRLT